MAALRRIIASKQHSSVVPPSPLPLARPQAKQSYTSSTEQHPAWFEAQVTAKDQQVSSPQCRLTLTKPVQQAEGASPKASLTEHAPESNVTSRDSLSCMQPWVNNSAKAETSGEAVGSARAGSCAHEWQVCRCMLALAMQFPLLQTPFQNSNIRGSGLQVTLADFKVAETRVQPSAMREVALEVCPCMALSACVFVLCTATK